MRSPVWILWLSAVAAPAFSEIVRTGCAPDASEAAQVTPADEVHVASAITAGQETCYEVTLVRGGRRVTGFMLGERLPAIRAFVIDREQAAVISFAAQDEQNRLQARHAKSAPATKPEESRIFDNFAAHDVNGQAVNLSGLGGRVTLVTFWSPRSPRSLRQLVALVPVFNQYRRDGLRALGISADSNAAHVLQALDDLTLGWPQVPDGQGLSAKYGADPRAGTTLVLDNDHRIVATGLAGSELEKKVRQLLLDPEPVIPTAHPRQALR